MKCKIIKFKQPKNEDNELIVPLLQDFENMREFEGETFKYLVENYIGVLEQAWLLITSNNNRLWKIDINRHCEYIGKLKSSDNILAFRVDVDLSKAVQQKFNEVSERVGCSLRIENNEVVRKETPKVKTYAEEYPNCYTLPSSPQPVDFAIKLKEIKVETSNSKISVQVPNNGVVTKITKQYSNGTFYTWEVSKEINEQSILNLEDLIDNSAKLVEPKPKMSDEEFKAAKEVKQELFVKKSFSSDIGNALNETVRWKLFRNYAEIYPLKISRNTIEDIFSFEFQGIDNGKQYLFYHTKKVFHAYRNMSLIQRYIQQSYLFDFFSKQLDTKITGMLINGHQENKILNPGDTVQFFDDRHVLWNFRLVKASDKSVEVSAT